MKALACEIHGLLRKHAGVWACPGWDGEGCWAGGPDGISDEAAVRLRSGQTRWPGVYLA